MIFLQMLFVLLLMVGVFMGVIFLIVTVAYGEKGAEGFKAGVLIMSNVYGMIILVVLLSYGLFNLPLYVWSLANYEYQFFNALSRAPNIFQEYRSALVSKYVNDFYRSSSTRT